AATAAAGTATTVTSAASGMTTSAASTPPSLGQRSPGVSVICEEVFDEACFPSSEEINDYAKLIGIEPHNERNFLYLAKEGLMAALPQDWKICYSEEKSGHYYHNTRTKQSQWDHPLDEVYRDLVKQARHKASLVETTDDGSQLDSGIRSMQGADEVTSSPLKIVRRHSLAQSVPDKSRTQLRMPPLHRQVEPSVGINESASEMTRGGLARGSVFQHRQQEQNDRSSITSSVKGILRDSSITDIRRRLDQNEAMPETEDKKSVRFNLEVAQSQKNSLAQHISRRVSHENYGTEAEAEAEDVGVVSENEDDEADVAVDVWDEEGPNLDALDGMCSLNPFLCGSPDSLFAAGSQNTQTTVGQDSTNLGLGKDLPSIAFMDNLNEGAAGNLLHDDTDSDSKSSSVRSFVINKSEQNSLQIAGNNPFDLEELGRKHSHELEILQLKSVQVAAEKLELNSHKDVIDLVALLKQTDNNLSEALLQMDMESLKRDNEAKLKNVRHEYDLRLASHQHQLEEAFELQIEEFRAQLEQQLQKKRVLVVSDHKHRMSTLQGNHDEILRELERDLHSEEDILRREHAARLAQMRDKLAHELDLEKQRCRENGEERLYEKVRCEKRLLEDKYRCLKEKYVRLKTDVKLSLERRNRRREAQALQLHTHTNNTKSTTGSETERSVSNKPSIGNSENRSLSYSDTQAMTTTGEEKGKPAAAGAAGPLQAGKTLISKPNIAAKFIKQFQAQDDNTSVSQSDTTISNTYNKGRYQPTLKSASGGGSLAISLSDNGNSNIESVSAVMMQCNQENNNNSNNQVKKASGLRKIVFSRTKSASTSRLNSDISYKGERPCTPVEILRHQLQKLEDLEDQFPDHTLDATYHLRYPFTDFSVEHAVVGVGSELEFFKHRIHLERDSVRRAKESLRTQRSNFRLRQREIKQRHLVSAVSPKRSLDQLIQEEKELTEMEVNLHRTRSLLGEKVIRLRHLEHSLLRIYEKEKLSPDLEPKDDAATLSDISSHSSSGFSSTDFDFHKRKEYFLQQESNDCIQNLEILNFEIREILDLLGQKQHHQPQIHQQSAAALPLVSPGEAGLGWPGKQAQHQASSSAAQNLVVSPEGCGGSGVVHMPHSIPTLADRLETYRQLAAGRMQSTMGGALLTANTIVSQSPRAVNYTTCLVERTRDLRNWLRQAKNEHDLLVGLSVQHGAAGGQTTPGAGGGGGAAAGAG
ncbi:hypothetical protein KR009_004225, partial [Drosophila setifemur]